MIEIFLGPPGTGKTETSIRIVEKCLADGVPPDRIAYLAFTSKRLKGSGVKCDNLPLSFFNNSHVIPSSK